MEELNIFVNEYISVKKCLSWICLRWYWLCGVLKQICKSSAWNLNGWRAWVDLFLCRRNANGLDFVSKRMQNCRSRTEQPNSRHKTEHSAETDGDVESTAGPIGRIIYCKWKHSNIQECVGRAYGHHKTAVRLLRVRLDSAISCPPHPLSISPSWSSPDHDYGEGYADATIHKINIIVDVYKNYEFT